MRLHIALPPDVGERVRTIAETEHRDVRRQIEKILIDSVRQYPDVAPPETTSDVQDQEDPKASELIAKVISGPK
jgi:hypothetical protein